MTWENVEIGKSGITCLKFPLSDEPRFGEWTISVNEEVSWLYSLCSQELS